MGLFHLAWFSPVPSLLQSGRKFSKYALLSSSLSMYLNFCEIPVFFCWQCCFLWKVLIVFFIFHFNTSYHTVTELNKGLVFLHCPLRVAFISCFLDYLYRKMMDWNRPVECRAKIIAQSNGLSVLKIKSWFTSRKWNSVLQSHSWPWEVLLSDVHFPPPFPDCRKCGQQLGPDKSVVSRMQVASMYLSVPGLPWKIIAN